MVEKNEKKYDVDGYLFESPKEAKEAEDEREKIVALKEKMDFSNIEKMQKLYERLIEKNVFKSPVGLQFLAEFRDYLINDCKIDKEEIPGIPVIKKQGMNRMQKENLDFLTEENKKLKNDRKIYFIAIITLGVIIVAMFVITALNPNVGYINTENKILNKYSAWEEDLSAREQALQEKEKALESTQDEN